MNLIVTALLGAGIGAGVVLILRSLQQRPLALAKVAARLDQAGVSIAERQTNDTARAAGKGVLSTVGLTAMRLLGARGGDRLSEQLRVLNKPVERHAYEKTIAASAGLALPIITSVVIFAAGVTVSPTVVLAVAVLLAVAGFFYPDLPLAEQVAKRRQAFRHAFSSYLDLVTILIAGGAGIETALEGAAEAGDGWAFAEIRRALRKARFTRTTPWDAFDQLGVELGVDELRELAASVSLAGGHGARIKSSLTAKADALRATQAAQIEQAAETQTEKMILPVVVMILGLVLFIAFGAVSAITDNGTTTYRPQPPTTTINK